MNGPPEGHLSARVHQACGIISVQAECTPDEALARLKSRAAAFDQSLEDTAVDVIDGTIRFDP